MINLNRTGLCHIESVTQARPLSSFLSLQIFICSPVPFTQKNRVSFFQDSRFIMRVEGLEPSRSHPRQILSLMRLPFRHTRLA